MLQKCIFDFCDFFKDKKSQFSNANLGYLDNFLGGMLESKLARNNLNFECYVHFFLSEHSLGRKIGGALCAPPPVIYVWQKVPSFKG